MWRESIDSVRLWAGAPDNRVLLSQGHGLTVPVSPLHTVQVDLLLLDQAPQRDGFVRHDRNNCHIAHEAYH